MHNIFVCCYPFSHTCMQPESQKRISHSLLTDTYPRYPDVFEAMKDYTPAERLMLMVPIKLMYLVISPLLHPTGSVTLHELMSVHHLSRGSTATGLQSLQDHGPQTSASYAGTWNCEYKIFCPNYFFLLPTVNVS